MPGFKDPPKEHQFKPGQSGNPNGRPRKVYKSIISDLRKKGIEPPSHEEYFEVLGMVMVMTESELKDMAKDKDMPYWIRALILDLNDKKQRQRLMRDHRDWLFGMAKQKVEHKGSFDVKNDMPTVINYTVQKPEEGEE